MPNEHRSWPQVGEHANTLLAIRDTLFDQLERDGYFSDSLVADRHLPGRTGRGPRDDPDDVNRTVGQLGRVRPARSPRGQAARRASKPGIPRDSSAAATASRSSAET